MAQTLAISQKSIFDYFLDVIVPISNLKDACVSGVVMWYWLADQAQEMCSITECTDITLLLP